MQGDVTDPQVQWQLLYTKPRSEAWAEANLRKQGFAVLLPRVRTSAGIGMLFPRYLFVGHYSGESTRVFRSTYGVSYVVHCGERPAIVPRELVAEIAARMDEQGIVTIDGKPAPDALFAQAERQRVRALVKLAAAGFRVRAA
jgi:hypothetical protein